jgi:hypothetical protein
MRERARDLVGRRARTTRDIALRSGVTVPRGTVLLIGSTWRGRFCLDSLVDPTPGYARETIVRGAERSSFKVLEGSR